MHVQWNEKIKKNTEKKKQKKKPPSWEKIPVDWNQSGLTEFSALIEQAGPNVFGQQPPPQTSSFLSTLKTYMGGGTAEPKSKLSKIQQQQKLRTESQAESESVYDSKEFWMSNKNSTI
eukprot:UN26617